MSEQRYKSYGELRWSSGAGMLTDKQFTSQTRLAEGYVGTLYDYVSRAYDPMLGRFISADTIVPQPGDPRAFNRYSYVRNSPLGRVDPTGHLDDDQLKAIFGDKYDEYMRIWKQTDKYWLRILRELQPGGILRSTGFGAELHIVGGGTSIEVFGPDGPKNLESWQGSGVFSVRNIGESDEQVERKRDAIFDECTAGSHTLVSPVFDYQDGSGVQYLGARMFNQKVRWANTTAGLVGNEMVRHELPGWPGSAIDTFLLPFLAAKAAKKVGVSQGWAAIGVFVVDYSVSFVTASYAQRRDYYQTTWFNQVLDEGGVNRNIPIRKFAEWYQ